MLVTGAYAARQFGALIARNLRTSMAPTHNAASGEQQQQQQYTQTLGREGGEELANRAPSQQEAAELARILSTTEMGSVLLGYAPHAGTGRLSFSPPYTTASLSLSLARARFTCLSLSSF